MPSRTVLERQLESAELRLSSRVEQLNATGSTAETLPTDPTWRRFNADCNALRRRLRAVDAVVANNEELARRKEQGDDEEAGEG
jgi:hypothetical protein